MTWRSVIFMQRAFSSYFSGSLGPPWKDTADLMLVDTSHRLVDTAFSTSRLSVQLIDRDAICDIYPFRFYRCLNLKVRRYSGSHIVCSHNVSATVRVYFHRI
jgi:hypothetical protein